MLDPRFETDAANASLNVASNLRKLGELEEARSLTESAFQTLETRFGKSHRMTADALFQLGLIDMAQQEYGRAIDEMKQAKDIWRRDFDASHPKVVMAAVNVGVCYLTLGRLEEADAELKAALAIAQAQEPMNVPLVVTIQSNLASLAYSQRDFKGVLTHTQDSIDLLTTYAGGDHASLAQPLQLAGQAQTELGAFDEARRALERSLELEEKSIGKDNPQLAYVLSALGDLDLERDRPRAALTWYQRAMDRKADPYILAVILLGQSKAYEALGDRYKARSFVADALVSYQGAGRVDDDLEARLRTRLSSLGAAGSSSP